MSDDGRDQRAEAREVQRSLIHVMEQNAQAQEQAREDEKKKAKEREQRDTVVQINSFNIDKLEGGGDAGGYKSWEEDVDSLLFAAEMEEVLVGSKKEPVEKVSDVYMDPKARRALYTKVFSSLGAGLKSQVRGVKKGDVEELLAKVRSVFLKKDVISRAALRKKITDAQLDHYPDLPTFIAEFDRLTEMYKECGGEGYDGENKIHVFLEAMPDEYKHHKTVIGNYTVTNPGSPMTWDQVTTLLTDAMRFHLADKSDQRGGRPYQTLQVIKVIITFFKDTCSYFHF